MLDDAIEDDHRQRAERGHGAGEQAPLACARAAHHHQAGDPERSAFGAEIVDCAGAQDHARGAVLVGEADFYRPAGGRHAPALSATGVPQGSPVSVVRYITRAWT